MIFASALFLYGFLPLFLALYALTPRRWKSLVIALASYVFYGWWRPDFVLLMLISTVVDFFAARGILAARARGGRGRAYVVLSLVVNLGLLGYFKYANFGVDTLNAMLEAAGRSPIEWAAVVLPVGISFYTFQTITYTVDVYRGDAPPVRGFTDFMCYVSLFPQLVAGPIVRYNTVAEQLRSREHTRQKVFCGVLAFQIGLAKKVLIADVLASVADRAFDAPALASAADAWVGTLAYAFQIYFDFSGYSDMAIGLGLMMGFRFPVNFDSPYRATSITDFWRRWHISLSTFLRDYLYIPLGGNRGASWKTYRNLALVMLLGGLWHGAAWTYLAWGAYQGFWLIVERLLGKRSPWGRSPHALQVAATFVLVLFGWVLFRAPDLSAAVQHAGTMLGLAGGAADAVVVTPRPLHLIAFAVGALVLWLAPTTQRILAAPGAARVLALQPVFLLALVHLHYQDHVPFLYFQF